MTSGVFSGTNVNSRRHFAGIALLYTAIAVIMTWPLMRHPTKAIASDLGDSLFVCWVLMWTGGQVLSALRGDVHALADYWNGNIFYPAPHTIAYSEHFTPQMLQMLPVYAAGGNILLCYNLLFLSTFIIAAFGMYLFVREITGRPLAAFLAGLAFAYAPYRLGQFPHLQIMSIGWMPLALFGLRRFFSTGRIGALAGGTTALVVQGLSCGYFLLFFSPLFAAFGLYEMVRRRMLGQWRVWLRLAAAAILAALVLYPFLRPYLDARASGATGARSIEDAAVFAADTHAFATIAPSARLLGTHLQGYPKPEGEGFPGFTILAFTAIALGAAAWRTYRRIPWASLPLRTLALWSALFTTFAISSCAVMTMFADGRLTLRSSSEIIVIQDATMMIWIAALSAIPLIALTRAIDRPADRTDDLAPSFWITTGIVAALLAFGPSILASGHLVAHGPYGWVLTHVPGFDGLRVPARFLTIVTLALAVLAGMGAATVLNRLRAGGVILVTAGIVLVLCESWFAPMGLNQKLVPDTLVPPGVPVIGRNINPLYPMVKKLPGPLVLIEFPFGEQAYDIQAVFFAGFHRRPLVNGYSGFFPENYGDRVSALAPAPANPEAARQALVDSGATHALVHLRAFTDGRGHEIVRWLTSLGAQILATSDDVVLLQLNLK
ncbi:MAG TPA: hypothetical protein VJN96_21310 [Vicinamibacterales bacterium]|nr:hypothetical protein [Vicinamibacterales bacterium]